MKRCPICGYKECKARHCVACGAEYTGHNHHCNPEREAKIEASRKSHTEMGIVRPRPTYGSRLCDGFSMARRENE